MIEGARSAAAFFRECVERALRARGVSASELVESYLVQLMTDLADPRRHPFGPGQLTLVDMLAEAEAAEAADRARLLREIGDCALVWSGVFRESLLHRGMSLSYYVSVGGGAYLRAGHLHRALRASPIDELCLELSSKFPRLSDALDEAATLGADPSDKGLLRLLDRSRRSARPWMLRLLRKGGIDPGGSIN